MNISIKVFPASYGDSFLVSCFGKKKINILIDTGFKSTYDEVIKKELLKLKEQKEDLRLVVFTHIDEDHILGGIKLLEENGLANSPNIINIEEIWHNSYKHMQFEKKLLIDELEIDSKSEGILKDIVSKGFIKETGVRTVSNIGFNDASTLTGLLYKNDYIERWNKQFNHQAIMVSKEENKLKNINLSDEVKLTLLSPSLEKLKELDKKWEKYLKELGYEQEIMSNQLLEDAFEIHLANSLEEKKNTRKTKNVSGEIFEIEDIIKEDIFVPDKKEVNGSSISFILNFKGKKILFLGDSHSDVIEESLMTLYEENAGERLFFDVVKISHHGSKHNTSPKFLQMIKADKYIISSNGRGKGFKHPDIETLSRIIVSNKEPKKIIFNYKPVHLYEKIDIPELKEKYKYELEYFNDRTQSIFNEVVNIVLE
ncbi:MBL fold metallo-hydrolase [Lysinibacillus sp. RS5]|uniref:MBL fold metallo-hydrolase n=1 Tax=unclassified Lysinibacillus TaxID=2636778 RepID=UPI0035BE6295